MISYKSPCCAADIPELLLAKKEKPDYIIHKVIQALNILEQFHDDVDELGLTEMSKRLAMKEESVCRLLTTLKSRNYIEQNSITKGYRLGFNILKIAQTFLRQTGLFRVSHPVLASVAGKCGETTSVAVLNKSYVIELDAVHAEHPVQVVPRVGVHLPVHCTAAGKVLIASETDNGLERLLKGVELVMYTPNTITCSEELRQQLRRIVEKGYAVDDEELDQEVRSVAAAIRDYAGRVVGAIVITGPSCRIDLDRLTDELISLVRRGAREISAKLGFHDSESQPPCYPASEGDLSYRRATCRAPRPEGAKPTARIARLRARSANHPDLILQKTVAHAKPQRKLKHPDQS
jgi:DNA-binding IclR family transcriptional regulator